MKNTRNSKKRSGSNRNAVQPKRVQPTFFQALELIPNQITFLRLLLLFPLWYLALFNYKTSFVFFFLLAGATDILDGYLARKLNQATHFGAAFDSLVDNLIGLSLIFWAYLWLPNLIQDHLTLILGLFILLAINLSLQLWTYHRFLPLHLYSGKTELILIYLFFAHAVLYGYSNLFLYICAIVGVITLIEEIIITLQRRTMHEGTKTVFH